VATSLIFFPAAPFFLFMHGKDITIPKGTELTAYVSGDMKLDRAKFDTAQSQSTPATAGDASGSATPPAAQAPAEIEISSTPDGADIEIDGRFVGSTPSTIGAAPGQHQLLVKKSGFKPWEKDLTVSSGHVKINATLETVTQ
jgi:PEGA domain